VIETSPAKSNELRYFNDFKREDLKISKFDVKNNEDTDADENGTPIEKSDSQVDQSIDIPNVVSN